MHEESYNAIKRNVEKYLDLDKKFRVMDFGSQDVNGSFRTIFNEKQTYVGVDMSPANGVDIVLEDPYKLPFKKGEFDAIVCGSCFEHCEFFWLAFSEIVRVTKKGGKIFIIVPNAGFEHRYPVDCYRFYPDAMDALAKWGKVTLLERGQEKGVWKDVWGVFEK